MIASTVRQLLALALLAASVPMSVAAQGNAHFRAGRAALVQDRPGEAIRSFERAIEAEPNVADHHYWLGTALGVEAQRAGKLKQARLARRAREEFERAVRLDPEHIGARQGLVQFYTLAPGFIGGSAAKAREQAAAIAKVSRFHGHLAHGLVAERGHDDAGARRAYEAAIEAAPDSAGGYIALGLLHQRAKRWDDAFAAYDRLLRVRPREATVLYHIGRAAALSGQHLERGERALERYIAEPPREATAYNISRAHQRLASIHQHQGRRADAKRLDQLENSQETSSLPTKNTYIVILG
jgi:tetratricopeptide (TPR) repeat protein